MNYCCAVGLFNKELLASGRILTSASIQKRYIEMSTRAKRRDIEIPEQYRIIREESPIIREESPKPPEVCDKVNKSKVNKSKTPPLPPVGESVCEKSNFDSSEATESLNQPEKEKEKSCAKKEKESGFEEVWEMYGKKGNRKTSAQRWANLKNHCREAALKHIPMYVESTPETQYRKNFETYLNQEAWNDEIIKKSKNETNSRISVPKNVDYGESTI